MYIALVNLNDYSYSTNSSFLIKNPAEDTAESPGVHVWDSYTVLN